MNSSSKLLKLFKYILCALIVLKALQISARDIAYLIKGQMLYQSSATSVASQGWSAFVDYNVLGLSKTTNVVLTLPNGYEVTAEWDGWSFKSQSDIYMTQSALDADIPNGVYTLKTYGIGFTPLSTTLTLTGNNYPANPQFLNFTAAQNVNPSSDFTLSWNSLGLTANDFIQVSVYDCNDNEVFITPDPMRPGALNGLATSVVIPAYTLYPGLQYIVELAAAKIGTVVTNRSSDGNEIVVVPGYIKILKMPLITTGTTAACFSWEHPNFVFSFPNGTIQGTNSQYTTPLAVSQYNLVFSVTDQNPPSSVTFTGPPGSGLNNTPSSWAGTGNWSSFGSPQINLTNLNAITGGVYTVNYKGVNLKFNLQNPQLPQRQIFLVPEFVVDNSGILRQINWSYKNQSGQTVPPQEYMEKIQIIVRPQWGGEFFSNYQLRPAFTNYVVTNTVVNWNDVYSVQIGFIDEYNGNYIMQYVKQSGPPPLQIISDNFYAVQGQQYYFNLSATGGMFPYTWRIEMGFLPSGLALDEFSGTIQGIPGEYGRFKVNISVTDALQTTINKDIYIDVARGSYTQNIAFTNMARINGQPGFQAILVPQHTYTLEFSTNLQYWKKVHFFTASSSLSEMMVAPRDFVKQNDHAFFRLKLGHTFDTDLLITYPVNAGSINPNSPYNVSVTYPATISGFRASFIVQFDPDYALMDRIQFQIPGYGLINPDQLRKRADNDDPGTLGYITPFLNGLPPGGNWVVTYKGTNFNFVPNTSMAISNLVIPVPVFTVSGGNLTRVSWTYRNPNTGAAYPSAPSFVTRIEVQIGDYQNNRIYNSGEIDDTSITSHTLQQTINWTNVSVVYMVYNDNADSYYVITFRK